MIRLEVSVTTRFSILLRDQLEGESDRDYRLFVKESAHKAVSSALSTDNRIEVKRGGIFVRLLMLVR